MMRPRRRTEGMTSGVRGLAAGLVLLAMAACSSGGGGTAEQPGSPQPRPSSSGRLSIVLPTNGESVAGSSVELKVSLMGAEIVPATTTKLSPDKGHLHVYLDDALVSMTFGLDQKIPNVAPGQHVFRVEFVASDHAPFDPRVFASVVFQVKP
jgi:hypothetical protein